MSVSNSLLPFFSGHCKTLAPVWDQLAGVYANNKHVKIVKVDCTVELVCTQHGVKGFPTLVLFKNGVEVSLLFAALCCVTTN